MSTAPTRRVRSREQSTAAPASSAAAPRRRAVREGSATPSVASQTSNNNNAAYEEQNRDPATNNEGANGSGSRRPKKAYINPMLTTFDRIEEEEPAPRSAPSARRSPAKPVVAAPPPVTIEYSEDEDEDEEDEEDAVVIDELVDEPVPVSVPVKRVTLSPAPKKGATSAKTKILAALAATTLAAGSGYLYASNQHPELVADLHSRFRTFTGELPLPSFADLPSLDSLRDRLPNINMPEIPIPTSFPDLSPLRESVASNLARASESAGQVYSSASRRASELSESAAAAAAGAYGSAKDAIVTGSGAASEIAKRRWEAVRDSMNTLKEKMASSIPSSSGESGSSGATTTTRLDTSNLATKEDLAALAARLTLLDSIATHADLDKLATKDELSALASLVSEMAHAAAKKVVDEAAVVKRDDSGKLKMASDFKKAVMNLAGKNVEGGAAFADEETVRSAVREALASHPALTKEDVLALVRDELAKLPPPPPPPAADTDSLHALLEDKLASFAADRIGMPDYALSSAGAVIVRDLTSPTHETRPKMPVSGFLSKMLGVGIVDGRPPVEAISRGDGMGECWAMNGTHGFLTIQLAEEGCFPTSITLQHIPKPAALSWESKAGASAPKRFRVHAVYDVNAFRNSFRRFSPGLPPRGAILDGAVPLLVAEYDKESPTGIKTYEVPATARRTLTERVGGAKKIKVVSFEFLENWGNPEYTCVYRVRVHGSE